MGRMLAAALALILGGCATRIPYTPTEVVIDRPPLGETARAEVGDTLVAKGHKASVPALILKNRVEDMFIVLEPQTLPLAYRDDTSDYYAAPSAYQMLLGQRTPRDDVGVCVRRDDPTFIGVFAAGLACRRSKKLIMFDLTEVAYEKSAGFVQELLYNGRSGNTVKLMYREFKDDWARPAFSQDLQYDLSQGGEIGFRGVRILIEDATNTSITYKVISSFRTQ